MKLSRFFIFFLTLVCSSAFADVFPKTLAIYPSQQNTEAFSDKAKGLEFRLSGVTKRAVLFFSIYEVALYRKATSTDLEIPFVLWLRYSRDLSKASIESALRKGLNANSKAEGLTDNLRIFDATLLPKLRDVEEGESLRLIRLSPTKAVVEINENHRSFIEGEQFLDALFSIWLGEDSVVSREELFSLFD